MRAPAWWLATAALALAAVALAEDPRPKVATVEDVRRLADGGEVEAAAGVAKVLLSERPNDVDVHVVYQDVMLALDGRKELLKVYKTRAQRDGSGPDDAFLYARLLEGRAAISEHARTLKLKETHLRTLLALGDLYLAENDLGSAAAVLTRAMNAEDRLAAPRIGLAEIRRREGDFEQAEEILRGAVDVEPGCVQARVELAVLLMESARYDDARAALETAASIDPDDPLPHIALGHLERMIGRDPAALAEHENRLQVRYDAAVAAAEQAAKDAADKGEEPPKGEPPAPVGSASLRAARAFRLATELAPRSFAALILLAHSSTMSDDDLSADTALRTAQGVRPHAAEPGVFRTRLFLDQDLVAEAEATIAGVLAEHRDLPVALYLHGLALARLGGMKKAEAELERAVKESGERPIFLRGLAAHQSANGRWRDALKIYQKVIKMTDAAPRVVFELALVQRGMGKPKDAAASLEALLAEDDTNLDAWLLLGRIYNEDMRKMEEQALECFLRYQELGGDNPDVDEWISNLQSP